MFDRRLRRCGFGLRCLPWMLIGELSLLAVVAAQTPRPENVPRMVYPSPRKSPHVDDYHGTAVADPYRWMEDTDLPETRAWIAEENALADQYFQGIEARGWIRERLTQLWNHERFGVPATRGGRCFFTRNDGLQNQSVLYAARGLQGEPELLLDPNAWSVDGTISLASTVPSEDGRLLAYAVASGGSDWREWRVRDVDAGKDLDDRLQWVKFSEVSWTPQGDGFYYSRYDEPREGAPLRDANFYQKLYFHRLGTPQSEDRLIYKRDDEKTWGFHATVSEDGQWLVIHVSRGSDPTNQVFILDRTDMAAEVRELITGFDSEYDFLGNDGRTLWFRTDFRAPRGRIIAVDVDRPERDAWREVLPEAPEAIDFANLVGERFVVGYLRDALALVRVFRLDGSHERDVDLPGPGSVAGFRGRKDQMETFYSFTSFTVPPTIYRYDIRTGESSVFRRPNVDFRSDDFETRQVFFTSKDGTRVPMFITHRRGLEPGSGDHPVHLYAYGGFNIPITPSFSVTNAVWLEMGGIYAVPNLRGGGEYGRAWHEAGMLERKQNVFDDFIAAAEYLIGAGYTSPRRLAISGRSNGGLLVGACMTQRPDLYAACLPGVGVMDMLRYHKFTIGWAWVPEFGSSDDPSHFRHLIAYSPLHNIRPGTAYPSTLVTTADHDDRVVPGHSFKFGATLQEAQGGDAPILIRVETRAGHGAGTPTSKLIDQATDSLSFLYRELGMEAESPRGH